MRCFVPVESFGRPDVRRAQIWKFGKQIPMRSHTVRLHFSVGQERKEVIEDVVGKRPAVARIRGGKRRIEMQDVGEQRCCHTQRIDRSVASRVLQRMCKNRNEATVPGRLRRLIVGTRIARQKNGLGRLGTAVRLNPGLVGAINRPRPDTERLGSESRARQLEDDAAHVPINKAISAVEVEVVDGADWIKKERTLRQPAKKR